MAVGCSGKTHSLSLPGRVSATGWLSLGLAANWPDFGLLNKSLAVYQSISSNSRKCLRTELDNLKFM